MGRHAKFVTETQGRLIQPVLIDELSTRLQHEYLPTVGRSARKYVLQCLRHLVEAEDLHISRTDQLDGDLVPRYLAFLEATLPDKSPFYRDNLVRALKNIYARANEWGYSDSMPEFPKPVPYESERIPPLPLRDVQRLLDHLRAGADSWDGHRGYALACTLAWAGLRDVEALDLLVEDIDLVNGRIRVRRREGKKTSILERSPVGIDDNLRRILVGWLHRTGCTWAFPGKQRSGPWKRGTHPSAVDGWFRAVARDVCIPGLTLDSLRRFSDANAARAVPGLRADDPPPPKGDPQSSGASWMRSPTRDLNDDEATRLLALLRQRSATWKGHRLYTIVALATIQGLRREEVLDLSPDEDIFLDRSPARLRIAGRTGLVRLTEDATSILRRWLERPDQAKTPWAFPNESLTGPWAYPGDNPSSPLGQLLRAAEDAGIPGRITFLALHRLAGRCGGIFEPGEAWRAVADPELALDGPKQQRHLGRTPKAQWKRKRRDRSGASPDSCLWDQPIPAMTLAGENDPVTVHVQVARKLTASEYKIAKVLRDEFPNGLTRRQMDERLGSDCKAWRVTLANMMKEPLLGSSFETPGAGQRGKRSGLYRMATMRPNVKSEPGILHIASDAG